MDVDVYRVRVPTARAPRSEQGGLVFSSASSVSMYLVTMEFRA